MPLQDGCSSFPMPCVIVGLALVEVVTKRRPWPGIRSSRSLSETFTRKVSVTLHVPTESFNVSGKPWFLCDLGHFVIIILVREAHELFEHDEVTISVQLTAN